MNLICESNKGLATLILISLPFNSGEHQTLNKKEKGEVNELLLCSNSIYRHNFLESLNLNIEKKYKQIQFY